MLIIMYHTVRVRPCMKNFRRSETNDYSYVSDSFFILFSDKNGDDVSAAKLPIY